MAESDFDMRIMSECFNSFCRSSDLQMNKEKSKVMVFIENGTMRNVANWSLFGTSAVVYIF